jgi:hypothetical protein
MIQGIQPFKRIMAQPAARKHDLLMHTLMVCTLVVIMWAFHSIVFEIVNQSRGAAQQNNARGSLLNLR